MVNNTQKYTGNALFTEKTKYKKQAITTIDTLLELPIHSNGYNNYYAPCSYILTKLHNAKNKVVQIALTEADNKTIERFKTYKYKIDSLINN